MTGSPSTTQDNKSLLPTRKWWAAFFTAVAGIAVMAISVGGFSKEVGIALVWAIAQSVVTWLVPNQDTPGGVPLKKAK